MDATGHRRGQQGGVSRRGALLGALLLCVAGLAFAAEARSAAQRVRSIAEAGTPLLQVFSSKKYRADIQNWAVVQDARGLIYVGNNDGVLEFDGAHWRLIRVGNGTTVRSLVVDASGRVFVGAQGDIGTLEPDPSGQMQYVSLLAHLQPGDRHFADVWTTLATPRGVLFCSAARIIQIGPQVRVWKPQTSFHLLFQVHGRCFVREVGRGLLELVQGEWQPLPGGSRFGAEKISAMLPHGDQILVATRTQGLFLWDGGAVRPFPTASDPGLKRDLLYAAVRLQDGRLALGTLNGGLYLLDDQGHQLGHLDQQDGLPDSAVYTLAQDRQGGLWMGLGKGLARIEVSTPLTSFTRTSGLDGAITTLCRHAGTLFVGTSHGLFRLVADPAGGRARFLAFPEIKSQTWALLDTGPALLVANYAGVYELRRGTLRLVRPSAAIPYALCRSRRNPARVFVGLQGGLGSMRWDINHWVDEGSIPGVTEDIRSLFDTADGTLWAGTNSQGVLRLTFLEGWPGGAPGPSIERFGVGHGLPDLSRHFVHGLKGEPLFATRGGLYRFESASGRFTPDPRFANLFPEGPRWINGLVDGLKEDAQGRIWMSTKDGPRGIMETGAAVPGTESLYHWKPTPLAPLAGSWIPSLHVDADGLLWLGGEDVLHRLDPDQPKADPQPFGALVRRVLGPRDHQLFGGSGPRPESALGFDHNALRFEFAAPSYDSLDANRFQVQLEGVDRDWLPWSAEAYRDYTNLREGQYRFRVRARDAWGRVSDEGNYAFRILPPWYRHPLAFVLWSLLLAGLIGAAFRWRLSALRRRNRSLGLAVAAATAGLRAREKDLETLNRRLYHLNETKNRIIGIAAHDLRNPLSIIRLHCDLVQEEAREPLVATAVEKIQSLGRNMENLIQRLLDVYAIEAGQAEKPQLGPMDLGEAVALACNQALLAAQRKDIELLLSAEGPALVQGDFSQVGQILTNFTSNALKFSPPGTRIELGVVGGAGVWRAFVRDQGPGLTGKDLDRVFGEYARLSASPTAGETSVGLGLSIAKRLAEAMGGRVGVDSVHGQGATFWVELPEACG